jgi:hypothetical protein
VIDARLHPTDHRLAIQPPSRETRGGEDRDVIHRGRAPHPPFDRPGVVDAVARQPTVAGIGGIDEEMRQPTPRQRAREYLVEDSLVVRWIGGPGADALAEGVVGATPVAKRRIRRIRADRQLQECMPRKGIRMAPGVRRVGGPVAPLSQGRMEGRPPVIDPFAPMEESA